MPNDKSAVVAPIQSTSLVSKFASRYNVEAGKILTTLKATCFKGDVSNEQMMALLIVADQYRLNPFTREIYAFPDKGGGIVPVVGVDGWARIINEHPQFDGMEFKTSEEAGLEGGEWIACTIYRKDRAHPTTVREYFSEVRRDTAPWKSHPRRMLRHKAMIQSARYAFGFAGIYDPDEAERIIEGERIDLHVGKTTVERIKDAVKKRETTTIEGEVTSPTEHAELSDPKTATGAPTYAEIAARINKFDATTSGSEVELCRDLARSQPEALRDELDDLIDARLKELATQAAQRK